MQGGIELALLGVVFLGLQIWWLSKVFLNRPRQPKAMGKSMGHNSLKDQQATLHRLFDQS